jgi:hypothetical protein
MKKIKSSVLRCQGPARQGVESPHAQSRVEAVEVIQLLS